MPQLALCTVNSPAMAADPIQKQSGNKWLRKVRTTILTKHQNSANSLGPSSCWKEKYPRGSMIGGVSKVVLKKSWISLRVRKNYLLKPLKAIKLMLKSKRLRRAWYRGKIIRLFKKNSRGKKTKRDHMIDGGHWRLWGFPCCL